jgi:hypothetical protein
LAKWCKLAFFGKVATGVIASILLALMQALRCPHCGRHLGAIAIIATVALASLQTLPWWFCGPPFTGVDARLLVVHSSKSISLIALALAPAPTAVRPAFMTNGARPFLLLHGSLIKTNMFMSAHEMALRQICLKSFLRFTFLLKE